METYLLAMKVLITGGTGLIGKALSAQLLHDGHEVTVLEKTNSLVAVAEDINYLDIADREDRTITDGQAVMEYVD